GMEIRNIEKANLLYNEIDRNSCFVGTVNKEDRSRMNVCFLPTKDDYLKPIDDLCKQYNIQEIKGHRSVGGYRASIYNAMPIESVQVLVDVMREIENKYG
nr:3-phosphoserine/phosphohydroxythreonine transaminase [Saprospiraceae bacterium]